MGAAISNRRRFAGAMIGITNSSEAHRANPHRMGIVGCYCRSMRRTFVSAIPVDWRTEPGRTRAVALGLNEQLRRLTQAFNNDIRETCTALLPDAKEIRELGTGEAHKIRYTQWASSHDRLLVKRIGIAVPEQGTLRLYGIDNEGRIAPEEWPANWEPLRAAMAARVTGSGRPPNAPPDTNIIELPVFDQRAWPAHRVRNSSG